MAVEAVVRWEDGGAAVGEGRRASGVGASVASVGARCECAWIEGVRVRK